MKKHKIIDIDKLGKSIQKKVIFNTFDKLREGEQLTLHASYDPISIKKVFEQTRPGFFRWNYVKDNETKWEIRITKHGSSRLTVNDIIELYPGSIPVFEKYQISYFLKGEDYLSDISKHCNMKESKLIAEIVATASTSYPEIRIKDWDIPFIIDFIVTNHHSYARKTLKEVSVLIEHIASSHLDDYKKITPIKIKFNEFTKDLLSHLREEEVTVFPAIIRFFKTKHKDDTLISDMKFSINWLREDHIATGTDLKCLRDLSNNYIPPKNACPALSLLFEEMIKFEKDQHFHIHLENNVLFTTAKKLLDGSNAHNDP